LYCIVIILGFSYVELHTGEIGIRVQPLGDAGIRFCSRGFFDFFHKITSTTALKALCCSCCLESEKASCETHGVQRFVAHLETSLVGAVPSGRTGVSFFFALVKITIGLLSVMAHA